MGQELSRGDIKLLFTVLLYVVSMGHFFLGGFFLNISLVYLFSSTIHISVGPPTLIIDQENILQMCL